MYELFVPIHLVGGEDMATSTFGKNFCVSKKSAHVFVKEMSRKAEPTMSRNFQSRYTPLNKDPQLREQLMVALGK